MPENTVTNADQSRNIHIDADALLRDLADTSKYGGTLKGGICRLALTEPDKQVRDWLSTEGQKLLCTITIDSMGNQFLRYPGTDESLPPLVMGSHLDTQPTGGKYDGIYGVLAGLSVIRAVNTAGYKPRHPIELVNWTNEEGARFSPAMISSGVFSGVFTEENAHSIRDRNNISMKDALKEIDYLGAEPCGRHPVRAYFELHIEQGPVLEDEKKTIGVVTGVQGMRRFTISINGQSAHAGTTPMSLRHDAMLAAAHLTILATNIAKKYGEDAKATVGEITALPGSSNVVCGDVTMTLDLRHPNDKIVSHMEKEFYEQSSSVCAMTKTKMNIERTWNSPSVQFDKECVSLVRTCAEDLKLAHQDIISGAGHDAAYLARICPTAMIFIPCRDGLSHNEAEHAEPKDIVAGANLLLEAILKADTCFDLD
ncbi:M20 family metallo-hydrolase [Acetobacter persici]|uniref:M20 family metallo-hydrolase n=1 Tax=Acetobacter persici TaxID=1076596 RepID=UPI001F405784|nr:M20 family metallo-hydrolase [Acetobacter persici]MCG0999481.1 M20 family metallo-hydrolase [Acetobacter persici]